MDAVFPTYARWDVEIESANGTQVTDINGKTYLDFISGIAVCNLGHRHPKVQAAIEEQLQKVWHVSNLFTISQQQEVAEILTKTSGLDRAFFCNSGAEANEAAIKVARKFTGKTKIITCKQSFHGRTFATMSATGQEKIHKGFGPLLAEFEYVSYNDEVAMRQAIDDKTAAVMVEIVQGEGGVIPGEKTFLQTCEELCKQHNALFIIDEVQTGIGRTGKPYAFQHHGLNPDVVTLAKGLGSGFPVGAMLGKEVLINAFNPGSHGSTFGGNPLAMAAAKATIDVIFQPDFLQEVSEKSEYVLSELQMQLGDNKVVKEIRGLGLIVGIECHIEVGPMLQSLREEGLLVVVAGPNVLRLVPPLTVEKQELKKAVEILSKEVKKVSSVAYTS